jgi:hypothetical protein
MPSPSARYPLFMRSIVRVESSPDGRKVATLLVGDGQVLLQNGAPPAFLASCVGFRTAALEAALRLLAGDEHHRLVVEESSPWLKAPPGTVLNGDDLLRLVGWQYGGDSCDGDPERMLHQAFLDTLLTVAMNDGRLVRVTDLSITRHYGTILEGSPTPKVNAMTRAYREALARKNGEPVLIIEPALIPMKHYPRGLSRYPRNACIASLRSAPIDPEQSWSELTLLWWEERLDRQFPELLASALEGIDWNAKAKDFYFC